MPALKILFSFSSNGSYLIEVKRLDLRPEAPAGDVYHWLFFTSQKIHRLSFRSMRSTPEKEFRKFLEGELVFDKTGAELSFLEKTWKLGAESVPDEVMKSASQFLGLR